MLFDGVLSDQNDRNVRVTLCAVVDKTCALAHIPFWMPLNVLLIILILLETDHDKSSLPYFFPINRIVYRTTDFESQKLKS